MARTARRSAAYRAIAAKYSKKEAANIKSATAPKK
ncbi:MAG: hypothetical protein A4E48_00246 [Methanosaeta sp. PtaU1.Bin060]|nr:MAG: hypothetical protein A4E48_00246 [Methanosaeta sp. PtaU1.Bin060]